MRDKLKLVTRLLRSDQWVKNAFVFSGLLFSERLLDPRQVLAATEAFVLFCAVASAGYLHNDISDREADRTHPDKRRRPIASGAVSITTGRILQIGLLLAGLGGALLFDVGIFRLLLLYVVMNLAYSKTLKHIVVIDVMVIGVGFVLRVLVGCMAVGAHASVWLLLCTFLLALFLGFGKRRHELVLMGNRVDAHRPVLGNYGLKFLDQMIAVVSAVTIVCYVMYTLSPETEARHGNTNLVFTVPFVLYGLFRYDFLIYQQSDGGNPTGIVLRDWPLILTVVGWVASCVLILYRF